MKALFLALSVFLSPIAAADLYKCTIAAKTSYQDKPCQTAQQQTIIPQQPRKVEFVPTPTSTPSAAIIARDARGRIKRSTKPKNAFKAIFPCPATGKRTRSCPGYVIDHIKPLACGGLDEPSNMQWQTVTAGKAKDGWERDGCLPSTGKSKIIVFQ